MPVIGTYNGASILAFPFRPGMREIALKEHNSVAVVPSPFTGQVNGTQTWPGADWWYADLSLPPLRAPDAAVWSAFLSSCRGMANVFPWGHPMYSRPQGIANGRDTPVVSGVNAAMTTTLVTRGWRPNVFRLLLPGDMLQIGATPASAAVAGLCRLHKVIDVVDSDSNGNATLNIWPSLRESITDGQAILLKQPKGLFRLAANDVSNLVTQTRLTGTSFQIVEAR